MFFFSFRLTHHKKILFLSLLIICFSLLFGSEASKSAGMETPDKTIPELINDFKTCALTSLKRVPQLQRSRMEINIRRLDEDDSRWSYFPTLSLSGNYYFSEDDATISLNIANYKPWEPYYTLQANELITQIVMLNHVRATAHALHKLADTLLHIITLDQIGNHYRQIIDLSARRLEYAEQRQKSAVTTPLELEIAQGSNDLITAEYHGNSVKRDMLLNGLSIAMNLPDRQAIHLDTAKTLEQILGFSDSPALHNLPRPEKSFERKIMAIKLKLQEKKITLAYSRYLPNFSFGVRSPDIINVSVDEDQDYFLYAGMNLTLWDGNRRSRDITRQKMVLRRMQFEKKEVENNDLLEWLKATQKYHLAKTEYTLSQSAEKFKRLQIKKKEFDYDRGAIKLPDLLNHKISFHRDRMRTIWKEFDFNKARLQLRHLSGLLLKDTVNISLLNNAYE